MTNKEAFECIKDYFKEPLEEVSKWFNIVEKDMEINEWLKNENR